MRFYTNQHQFYCGIDLHARSMYVCILEQSGEIILHRNMKTKPDVFLRAIEPYHDDIVFCAESMCSWYWLADLRADEKVPFALGAHYT